jgi:bacteriocin-like protein
MPKEPRDEQQIHAELTDEDLENVNGGAGVVDDVYEDDCTPPR